MEKKAMPEPAHDFSDIQLAVIGGSGFYTMPGLEEIQKMQITWVV